MIEEFNKYTSDYDITIPAIKRKYNHSLRVMNLANKYARLLNFSAEDVELASVIGLLHDIGRFEQYRQYHTFDDFKSINHGDYGAKILMQNNFIEKFYSTSHKENYKIIEFAIRNHNKLFIESHNNERFIQHAKLIRDVDKIDLLFLRGVLQEVKYEATDEELSPLVIECIQKHQPVNKKYVKNINDRIALRFGFVFDINYDICLEEFRNYLVKFYEVIGDDYGKLKDVYDEVLRYIDKVSK